MKIQWILVLSVLLFFSGTVPASPYFLLDSRVEWEEALGGGGGGGAIAPLSPTEWDVYIRQWNTPLWVEGKPYAFGATVEFHPAQLLSPVSSEPAITPHDDGLAMLWMIGQPGMMVPPGNYASAWKWEYGMDPDLTNCTITLTVSPPQFGPTGQINTVSFGIQDAGGAVRSWWWGCGPGQPIPWAPPPPGQPTKITINTAMMGVGASIPAASGFVNNPAFNIKQSMNFIVDENANFQAFAPLPVPQFGQQTFAAMWNYWHNVLVTPNTSGNANKGTFVKYSQPPVVISEPGQVPCKIRGWDELSIVPPVPTSWQWPIQGMADDWACKDDRPVTDIHWWGSYLGWTQPFPPPVVPQAFHIGIWTDVPGGPGQPVPFSHPGTLIWQHICTNWVWNFAGYDVPPTGMGDILPNEACFQFNQLLSEPDWFRQEPGEHIYWLSIAAIYPPNETAPIQYPWGWKTRPHIFQDDAVRIFGAVPWPGVIGVTQWQAGQPVEFPAGVSWDLAFEITTNVPGYCDNPIPGDINCDKKVDLADFAIFASNWLATSP
jgi:hypothetical protein